MLHSTTTDREVTMFRFTLAEEATHAREEIAAENEENDFGLDPEIHIPESLVSVNPEWDEIAEIADFDEWAESLREHFRNNDF